jgi:hypothetical protein
MLDYRGGGSRVESKFKSVSLPQSLALEMSPIEVLEDLFRTCFICVPGSDRVNRIPVFLKSLVGLNVRNSGRNPELTLRVASQPRSG